MKNTFIRILEYEESNLSRTERGDSLRTLSDGIYGEKDSQKVYVSQNKVNWFTSIGFHNISINPKYVKQEKGKPVIKFGNAYKWDVAPINYPKDLYVLKLKDMEEYIGNSTYILKGNKKVIKYKYQLLEDKDREKLTKFLKAVGWEKYCWVE